MTPPRLDLVVFGASGFTGRRVVGQLVRILRAHPAVTWGVAGRNADKLEKMLRDVAQTTDVDISAVPVIIASVEDAASLCAMCARAKVLVNCCGPAARYGEPVVVAALRSRTHYVDVSGEPQFIELLENKYSEAAREAGVYVINACGLNSVPADLGVVYLEQNFGGTLNSVESYLITHFPPNLLWQSLRKGVVRYSTWESIINSIAYMPWKTVRQNLPSHFEPELKPRSIFHRNLNKWCLPFPGIDIAVVQRTQRHLWTEHRKRPVQYQPYLTFPGFFTAIGTMIACSLLFVFSKIYYTRKLMINYPRLCSFGLVTYGDPKEGVLDDSCLQYEMIGRGWKEGTDEKITPAKEVIARVSVSGVDPAYIGTAVAIIYSALMIIKEKNRMPSTGGVMTPGIAFRDTSIIKHLQENDFKFQIVEKS